MFKKIWNFLFGKKEEPIILETVLETVEEKPEHCSSHLRFRKSCPDCLRIIGAI
jgi:hypothetical protein